MKTPSTYSDWCDIFDKIEKWDIGYQDFAIMEAIDNGTLAWISGVAERITQRLLNLINSRLHKLNVFFQKRIYLAANSFEAENLFILFKKELKLIKHIGNLQIFPEDLRCDLVEQITMFAKKFQKDMEDSAKKDLSGYLKRMIINNRLDNI